MREFQLVENRPGHYELYRNDVYQVSVTRPTFENSEGMGVIWLAIRRLDGAPIHEWRDLQAIKNRLVGPAHEAIEIYPAEERVVDFSNSYHLWVFADPAFRLPLGFSTRIVGEGPSEDAAEDAEKRSEPRGALDRQQPFRDPPQDALPPMQSRRRFVSSQRANLQFDPKLLLEQISGAEAQASDPESQPTSRESCKLRGKPA